jgi:two-component system, LytTR family, response regulator
MTDTPRPMNCLIVDDEPNAIRIIQEYLTEFPNIIVTGTAGNAFDALVILNSNPIDLLFLDIQMPQITGFQLLKTLLSPPSVIITTAHRDYAVDAFDFQVLDYLLKPISFERFSKAIDRFFQPVQPLPLSNGLSSGDKRVLTIRSDRKDIRIPLDEILYVQAMGDYVVLHLASGVRHMTIETLSGVSARLPEKEFARIHRSYIVNKRHIRAISTNTVEIAKITLPCSRNYRPFI